MEQALHCFCEEESNMNADNQINVNEENTFIKEQSAEITPQPAAPSFDAAEAAPVQPLVPLATLPVEASGVYPQQPQVVYVPQPTVVEPRRSLSWVPAALALLVVATVAGVFIGAALYKRSIYAESASPYSSQDVLPADANAVTTNKPGDRNSLADKTGSVETVKSTDGKSEAKQINSVSTDFAPIQKTSLKDAENDFAAQSENESDEDAGQAENEIATEKKNRQTESSDEEEPPPPASAQRKVKELQPKKVENVKDTENVAPPERSLPDFQR